MVARSTLLVPCWAFFFGGKEKSLKRNSRLKKEPFFHLNEHLFFSSNIISEFQKQLKCSPDHPPNSLINLKKKWYNKKEIVTKTYLCRFCLFCKSAQLKIALRLWFFLTSNWQKEVFFSCLKLVKPFQNDQKLSPMFHTFPLPHNLGRKVPQRYFCRSG